MTDSEHPDCPCGFVSDSEGGVVDHTRECAAAEAARTRWGE